MSTNDNLSAESSKQSLTKDQLRTFTFVGVAAACLIITGVVEWVSRPEPIEDFGRVGQEFYPDFTDPTLAKSLEVDAFDVDSARPQEFKVEQLPNGRWVIPTHHDYPADAEEQLAKTAASIIGIKRGALVTRWKADHARYGVVNPKQDSLNVEDVEGVGKRITLRGDDDTILADYIIGKKTDDESGQYYVRHPEEDEVYIADLDINLSTKFTDWINTDLLELDAWDVRHVTVNNYKYDELQNRVTSSKITKLDRKTSSDPWTLEGLDEETEQVNEDAVRETVNTIADLKIVGVRPKQEGLTPDLKLDRNAIKSQNDLDMLQSDLITRGFLLQQVTAGDPNNLRLLAREGELYAATEKGLRYSLYFGRAFTGSQEELEIGLNSDEDESNKEEAKKDEAGAENGDADSDEEAKEESTSNSNKPGRYVFVRVEFDKQYLGEEPVKPEEPVEPEELKAAEAKKAEEAKEEPKEEAKEETEAEAKKESAEGDEADEPKENPLEKLRQDYEAAKQKYESDLREYESNLEQYNKKIEDGKKLAEDLNRRFAEWYYVIPGDSFDKLRLTRADFVKPKEKEDEGEGEGAKTNPAGPDLGGDLPGAVMPKDPTADQESAAAKEPAAPVVPAKKSTEAGKEAAEPAKEAAEPAKEAAGGAEQATEPPKNATEPAKEPIEPAKEAAKPAKEMPEQGTEATEPAKEATEPEKGTDDNG